MFWVYLESDIYSGCSGVWAGVIHSSGTQGLPGLNRALGGDWGPTVDWEFSAWSGVPDLKGVESGVRFGL